MDKIISSFFTSGNSPATGLTPSIRVWSVDSGSNNLIITDEQMSEIGDGFYKYVFTSYDPATDYVIRVDGGNSLNVEERYQYAGDGADAAIIAKQVWDQQLSETQSPGSIGESIANINDVVANVDQSVTNIPKSVWDRQLSETQTPGSVGESVAGIRDSVSEIDQAVSNIPGAVWDSSRSEHLQSGSFGEAVSVIRNDVSELRVDVSTMMSIVNTLLKYESNRTVIDKEAKTLTVYDNDGTTVIQVFALYDSEGRPSTAEVCERVPS